MKKYYKSIEDLDGYHQYSKAIPAEAPDEGLRQRKASRRDFLRMLGCTAGYVSLLSACEQPIRKAIPHLIQAEELTPGESLQYASTYFDGSQFARILARVRDGRPVKLKANPPPDHICNGTTARVQASILDLYDPVRYRNPMHENASSSWEEADALIPQKLAEISRDGRKIQIITPSMISPSAHEVLQIFSGKYPTTETITYDAVSCEAMLQAFELFTGSRMLPSYRIDKAKLVIGFQADFLGSWLDPAEFTRQYTSAGPRHIQFETTMSLTGAKADERIPMRPSAEKAILMQICRAITGEAPWTLSEPPEVAMDLNPIIRALKHDPGKSLVLSSTNDLDVQLLCLAINEACRNIGETVDIGKPSYLRKGNDRAVHDWVKDMDSGISGAVIFYGANPVYDYPLGGHISAQLGRLPLSVSLACMPDETSAHCQWVCPDHHPLESWNDFESSPGMLSLSQPVIKALFNTRQAADSLLAWAGHEGSYLELIKSGWEKNIFPLPGTDGFEECWTACVREGGYETEKIIRVKTDIALVKKHLSEITLPPVSGSELHLYETVALGPGISCNNPWLQELPDPVTKVAWGQVAAVSPDFAGRNDLQTGDVIRINDRIELPVLIQPGQADNTISVALGYGRNNNGPNADGIGVNAYPLVQMVGSDRRFAGDPAIWTKTGQSIMPVTAQSHDSMEDRDIALEISDRELEDAVAGEKNEKTSLYPETEYHGHHWGMVIDLDACTGCNACLISCQAENNIPVVGAAEVKRGHAMHWIRMDRYYSGDPSNPRVIHQPVMCQHCDHAPCENVCPVAATNHSSEGLNQMVYNRCIGTRYCANNCPYKVRSFNWFDYNGADVLKGNTKDPSGMTSSLSRLVLNPDVTSRSKGVIEKCSFCIQRIQAGKRRAKLENRPLKDHDIVPACEEACPAGAITFGDMNDPESRVASLLRDPRNYQLLGELHTLPSVSYMKRIRQTEP